MDRLKTTNALLLIIALPIFFYVLKILSFIFIPLLLSMFIALLFLPLMRWFQNKKWPKSLSILSVILLIVGGIKIGGELIKLSSREILSADADFLSKATNKLLELILMAEGFLGIERVEGSNVWLHYINDLHLLNDVGTTFNFISNALSTMLMTIFFVVLLLAESINFQKLLNTTIIKHNYSSIKIFAKIEKDLIKFIVVKLLVSAGTGIGIGLACHFFGVSFPIFWGLFAFVINFIQMIGSFVSVITTSLFALIEHDATGMVLFFVLTITAVQVLFGGILEPIFMGKSFSINIVTILVMLMFWGYIWGIPGMIMSIPITVFLKIMFEQFKSTRMIATLMDGNTAGKR
ncbi:AI-2E family transporter [Labilibacter marinus]|uniref:AI-2E family transporter n=1 Tax=Labilibacter marinus TaxID=1477105 RepID=UPI0009502583|nr:AI-2E family transporter [Labilibacter marinus]